MRRPACRPVDLRPLLPLVLCAAALALTGCMPIKQENVTGGQLYDHFSYDDWDRHGLLQIGPSNVHKTVRVVDAESYAIAPNGKRYGIATEPHRYDLEDPDDRAPYVRDRVYLVDDKGRRSKRNWADGWWEFVFVLDTPHGRDSR
ncbi:MAG: hypothetical protein AVDCRST_MAG64-1664, partial [uncultured Phycisphaerae bacterium]